MLQEFTKITNMTRHIFSTYSAETILFYLWVCYIVISIDAERRRDVTSVGMCPRCAASNIPEEKLRKLRIELVKAKILQKLRLSAPPVMNGAHPKMPDTFFQQLHERHKVPEELSEPAERFGKTTDVVLLPEHRSASCYADKPAACFLFKSTALSFGHVISSAALWVQKTDFDESQPDSDFLIARWFPGQNNTVAIGEGQPTHHGNWMKFEIGRYIQNWTVAPATKYGIIIKCNTCSGKGFETLPISVKGAFRPFLAVHFRLDHFRNKRSADQDCAAGITTCCRDHISFNFREIEWDWVLYPKRYDDYYCRGSCKGPGSGLLNPMYNHTLVMQLLKRKGLEPCCAPKRLLGMSIFYHLDGSYKRVHLADMSVDACGCA